MIKIMPNLYIHFTTVIMLAVCFINKKAEAFLFSYGVMVLHEFAHLLAALLIGLKTDKLVFYPYGVNLKLKNKFIHSLADEIILYISGPLANCLMALISGLLYGIYKFPYLQLFYIANLLLFAFNMLPVYPLDGGIILKKILIHFYGRRTADIIMLAVSVVLIIILVTFGIYTVYVTEFNFSVFLLASFLICSIFTQNEKYDSDFVKELMFYKKKKKKSIKHIIASDSDSLTDIAKNFRPNKYAVVYIQNQQGKITEIMSENEIMNDITSV